jgi:hypothetical protein
MIERFCLINSFKVKNNGDHNDDYQVEDRYKERHEERMVFYTDTVVYPRTMVIESFYTSITDTTMSRSGCSNHFTIWT